MYIAREEFKEHFKIANNSSFTGLTEEDYKKPIDNTNILYIYRIFHLNYASWNL